MTPLADIPQIQIQTKTPQQCTQDPPCFPHRNHQCIIRTTALKTSKTSKTSKTFKTLKTSLFMFIENQIGS